MSASALRERVRAGLPPLSWALRKGQRGRVGVLGGSLEYSGAPFFAAAAALRCGADLAHVFCPAAAGAAIKAFSPDLIVHPVLPDSANDLRNQLEPVTRWLGALDVLVVGPGLGREEHSLAAAREIIGIAEARNLALLIDGDGLWALRGHDELLLSLSPNVILTPNVGENARLEEQLAGRPTAALVVRKGLADIVGTLFGADSANRLSPLACDTPGAPRRCGGQGDVLAGAVAAFLALGKQTGKAEPQVLAWAACDLVRQAAKDAFSRSFRGMLASDVLAALPATMQHLYPV